jgi:hypothetical protein
MAGPWDSPKVVTENSLPNVLPDMDRQELVERDCRFYQQRMPRAGGRFWNNISDVA